MPATLPMAIGGVLGGNLLSKAFGGGKKKSAQQPQQPQVTQGVVGPSPSTPSYGF